MLWIYFIIGLRLLFFSYAESYYKDPWDDRDHLPFTCHETDDYVKWLPYEEDLYLEDDDFFIFEFLMPSRGRVRKWRPMIRYDFYSSTKY